MHNSINSIKTYIGDAGDVLELLNDYAIEIYHSLTEEQKGSLQHLFDYEGIAFVVINDNTVFTTDLTTGSVYGYVTIDEFIEQVLDELSKGE